MKDKSKKTDKGTAPTKPGFKSLNPTDDGEDMSFAAGEQVKFEEKGDRIVGVLMGKQQVNIEDNPYCYRLRNLDGDWWFWGSTVLDARFEDIEPGSIVDITSLGERVPTAGTRKYKDFTVLRFKAPTGFNLMEHTVNLNKDTGAIDFHFVSEIKSFDHGKKEKDSE